MRLGKYLSSLTKPEIDELRELLNLSDENLLIFDFLSIGKTRQEISTRICMSSRAIDRKIREIKNKIFKIDNNLFNRR